MDNLPLFAAKVFMAFFAIMNPIANTSIFIGLTDGDDAATKKAVARQSLLVAVARRCKEALRFALINSAPSPG